MDNDSVELIKTITKLEKERDEAIAVLQEASLLITGFVRLVGKACPDADMYEREGGLADQSDTIELRIASILKEKNNA